MAAATPASAAAGASVREARAEDLPAIADYLADRYRAPEGPARYRRYLEVRWPADRPDLGVLIEQGGRIRGFMGAVYARRTIRGQVHRFCNLTSLMVDEEVRRLSLQAMKRLLAKPDHTYTSFSASAGVVELLRFFKFTELPGAKVVFTPAAGLSGLVRRGVRIRRADRVRDRLTATERAILDDHAGYRLGHFLLEAPEGRSYFVTARRGRGAKAFADVLHAGDPALLARHIAHAHLRVGLLHRTALIGIDRRFLPVTPPGAFVYARLRPILYRSPSLGPDDLDMLYSEVVPMHG